MSDTVAELRERSLRAEQEGEPFPLLDEAADEISRLRLTDEEKGAIATAARIAGAVGESDIKATLKALLKRLK